MQTNQFQFQAMVGQRLIQWGGLSTGLGAILMTWGSSFRRGIGSQFIGWGIIDALIGWFGLRSSRKQAAQPDAHTKEAQSRARTYLRRVLAINTGLDVLYVSGGLWLAGTQGKRDRFWRGAGIGIVIQGAFLFVFDLMHVLLLQDTD
jgi:hypothetical protein